MTPEAELLRVLQAGDADITRHRAWLDLFLELPRPASMPCARP